MIMKGIWRKYASIFQHSFFAGQSDHGQRSASVRCFANLLFGVSFLIGNLRTFARHPGGALLTCVMGIRCKISRFCLALADGRLLKTLVGLRWMRWWIAGGKINTLHSNMATHMPAFNILEVQWRTVPNTMRDVLPKKAGRPWSTPWITRRSRRLSVLLHNQRGPAVWSFAETGTCQVFWGCACLCICWSWVTRRLRWACGTWDNNDTAKKRSRRKHLSVFDSRYSIWFCVWAPIARGRFSSSKPNGFRLHPYGHPNIRQFVVLRRCFFVCTRGWRHELI